MPTVEFYEPKSIEEACQLLGDDDSRAVAGGTAVSILMRSGLLAPSRLVSLGRIGELTGIEDLDDRVRIGATTTLTEVAESPVVKDRLPSLAMAAAAVGNVRVRNVATLGGNLAEADYASDPPAILAALGATCEITGQAATTRTLAVDEFITGFYSNALEPGEVLTALVVPTPTARRTAYHRFVSRSEEDRPCVTVAVTADMDGAEVGHLDVVVGAVSDRPQRVDSVLSAAAGRRLTEETIDEIAATYRGTLQPMSDLQGSEWYRRQLIHVLVRRALHQVASPEENRG